MKKFACFFLVLAAYLTGCTPTNDVKGPTKTLTTERFVLVQHPTDPNDIILCIGSRTAPSDPSTFIALRDCFSNELISCVDSEGKLKDSIVLCLASDEVFESNRSGIPTYEKDGNENYFKIYLTSIRDIYQDGYFPGDTAAFNFMGEWRKYLLFIDIEVKSQSIEDTQFPSHRLFKLSYHQFCQ